MALRTVPFGYCVKNGKTVVDDNESKVVKEVFSMYSNGKTMKDIALTLTNQNIVYSQGKSSWNKNTINRMLENEKYMGNDIYPIIVSCELFYDAKRTRENKSCKQKKHSNEVELLRKITFCGKCGSKYKRINTWGSREKWMCSSGCSCLKYIDDPTLEKAIAQSFNSAIDDPELINTSPNSYYYPTIEAFKEENELNRLMDQIKFDSAYVSECIVKYAKERFNCCTFDVAELTEELKCKVSHLSIFDRVDYKTMRDYIKQIKIYPNGEITTIFINNAEITYGGA